MKTLRIFSLVLFVATLFVGNVYAETNWGPWLWQTDGSYWRMGVDDNGIQHCQTKPSERGFVTDVSCKK